MDNASPQNGRTVSHAPHGRRAATADTVLNAVLLAIELVAIVGFFCVAGFTMFRMYTECSNALAAVAAVLCLVSDLRRSDPALAHRVKFCACAMQLMTVFVVVFVLLPTINAAGGNGFDQLFVSNGRYLVHFFGPLLTLVSYLGFETDPLPAARDSWLALVPTLIYAAVIYTLNYLRVLEGPYPFFRVWSMPLWQTAAWFVALLILAWLLARVTHVAARWIATSRARRR